MIWTTIDSKDRNKGRVDLAHEGLDVYVHIDVLNLNNTISSQHRKRRNPSCLSPSLSPLKHNGMHSIHSPLKYYNDNRNGNGTDDTFNTSNTTCTANTPLRNNFSKRYQDNAHHTQTRPRLDISNNAAYSSYSPNTVDSSSFNFHHDNNNYYYYGDNSSLAIPTLFNNYKNKAKKELFSSATATKAATTLFLNKRYNHNNRNRIYSFGSNKGRSISSSSLQSLIHINNNDESNKHHDDITFSNEQESYDDDEYDNFSIDSFNSYSSEVVCGACMFVDKDNGVVTFEYKPDDDDDDDDDQEDHDHVDESNHQQDIHDDQDTQTYKLDDHDDFKFAEWNTITAHDTNEDSSRVDQFDSLAVNAPTTTNTTSGLSKPNGKQFALSSTSLQIDRDNEQKQYLTIRLACLEVAAEQYKKLDVEVPDIIVAQVNDHRHQLQDHNNHHKPMLQDNNNNCGSCKTTSPTDGNSNKKNHHQARKKEFSSKRWQSMQRQRIRLRHTDEIHVSPCQCALSLVGMKGKTIDNEDYGISLFSNLIGLDKQHSSTNPLIHKSSSKSLKKMGKRIASSSMVRTQSAHARDDKDDQNGMDNNSKPRQLSSPHHRTESGTFDAVGYHEITLIRNRSINVGCSTFFSQDFLDWDAITIRCSNHDELDILVEALKGTSKATVVPFSSNPKEKLKLSKEKIKRDLSKKRRRLYSDPSDTLFMGSLRERSNSHESMNRVSHDPHTAEKSSLVGIISEECPAFITEVESIDNQESNSREVNGVKDIKHDNVKLPAATKEEKESKWDFHFNKMEYCEVCHLVFTLLTRRHHCRQCQRSICGNCSSNLLVKGGDEKRFCIRCSADILRKQSEALRGRISKKNHHSGKLPGKVHPACHSLGVGVMGKLPHWRTFLNNINERPAVGRITIEVMEAIALPSANMLNGTVDPYVRATITGYDRDMLWTLREWMPSKRYSLCTGYVTSTLSPQWRGSGRKGGELLTLPIISTAGSVLKLEVLDNSSVKKDLVLGVVEIPLSDLPNANLRQPGGISVNSNGKKKTVIYDGYCDRWYRLLSSDQVSDNSVILSKPIPCPLSKEPSVRQNRVKPHVVQKSLEEIGRKVQGLWIHPIEWVASAIRLDLPARRPEATCEEHKSRSMIHVRIKLNASYHGDILSHAWFPPVKPYPSVPPFDPQILFGRFVLVGKQLEPYKKIQEYIENIIKWKHDARVCVKAYFIFAIHLALLPYLVKLFHVYLFIFLGIRLRNMELESNDDNTTVAQLPHVDSMTSEDMALADSGQQQDRQKFENSPSLAELNDKMGITETKSLGSTKDMVSKNDDETARLNIAVHWIAKKMLDNKGLEILQFKLGHLGRDLKNLNSVWNGTNPLLTRAAMVYLVVSFILHFIVNPRILWLVGTFVWYFGQSPFCILCIRMFFGFWRGIAKGLRRQHLLDAEILESL